MQPSYKKYSYKCLYELIWTHPGDHIIMQPSYKKYSYKCLYELINVITTILRSSGESETASTDEDLGFGGNGMFE